MSAAWFPRLLASAAALIGLAYGTGCVLTPVHAGDQVFLGYRFVGTAGWAASALHAVFFAWLAYASWRRRRVAAWGAIGYCVYLIENVWIYSTGQGRDLFPGTMQMVISNSLLSAVLLVFCRIVLKRMPAFER